MPDHTVWATATAEIPASAPLPDVGAPPEISPLPSSRRSSRTVGIATVTAALLAASAYVIFSGSESHTLTGDLSLTAPSLFSSLSPGDSCQGSNGYDDIGPGTEVVVEDQTGTTLSTGHFGNGTYDGVSCVFDFTFTNVPKAAFYRVHQSGNRGVLQFSYDEMVKNHWSVHLTLGN